MKAITLTNPKGEKRDLTNVEFFELQTQYVKSKAFSEWSAKRKISGYIGTGKDVKISPTAVNMFLKESGYEIINHLHP